MYDRPVETAVPTHSGPRLRFNQPFTNNLMIPISTPPKPRILRLTAIYFDRFHIYLVLSLTPPTDHAHSAR